MTIYESLRVPTLINAKGTATRLSGGIMLPEVVQAMLEASQACVDMAELQAAASREIAKATGAESGYIASGASACLLLGAAACIAGLDPGRMARLPDTRGMKNEVIMVRSQRNFYDHAIRAAGATIIEVGLPDRYTGAGVRDAEIWEIEDAITPNTAAIFYVADAQSQPALRDVTTSARRHRIPVIVDAAAQLPPQSNLKRFIAEGADLVAFSGGKALGGPASLERKGVGWREPGTAVRIPAHCDPVFQARSTARATTTLKISSLCRLWVSGFAATASFRSPGAYLRRRPSRKSPNAP